ncbi:hypothetical protein [Congregibacter litoralis]|uniref:Uncharacterized protein n=1 Tax=Congregibacter litoralis KT71 TaxID=314285 RepID=A4A8M4_9GAMM|nr:hypothetical protein [Congregibacter litoralis]EAQ97416.1 hypothetical protein KT71_03885 [Congregibacter litoralis KT71]
MNYIIAIVRTLLVSWLMMVANANADLGIHFVEESSLPYELSPRNYDNSPSNYDNSVSNYDNSVSNYDNSPNNYDNSKNNYDNGKSGSQRLLVSRGEVNYFAGYYVFSDAGVLNFFSVEGERLYFSPAGSSAVFLSESGDFAGTVADMSGETVLALTDQGQLALIASGISPPKSALSDSRKTNFFRGYICTDDCSGHIAGYTWALKNKLSSASQCGGKSESFIEGCISAFIEGSEAINEESSASSIIRSTIDGEFEGFEGDTIVKLSNGQVWQQTEYLYHYHYSYMAEVTIFFSSGTHRMLVEGIGKPVAVVRLR